MLQMRQAPFEVCRFSTRSCYLPSKDTTVSQNSVAATIKGSTTKKKPQRGGRCPIGLPS